MPLSSCLQDRRLPYEMISQKPSQCLKPNRTRAGTFTAEGYTLV